LSDPGAFTESVVEQAALSWLEGIGWPVRNGADVAPDGPAPERRDFSQVVLETRLRDALARLNPALPPEALDDAFRKLTRPEGADLLARNRAVHRLLVDGVTVEYRTREGEIRGGQARVVDFERVADNDWLAINQFTVIENKRTRRLDVVLFVNGLPRRLSAGAASARAHESGQRAQATPYDATRYKRLMQRTTIGGDPVDAVLD
jgi:type I restriction enzyme R subunit